MNAEVKLERERRATMREEKLWALLSNPAFVEPLGQVATMLGTYYAGKARLIDRDVAGVLFGLEAVLAAARHGVNDRYALLGIWSAMAGTYAAGVRPTEEETIVELQPFGGGGGWSGGFWSDLSNALFGSDDKFYFWKLPWGKG